MSQLLPGEFLQQFPFRSDWKRPAGRPHTYWLAALKNDLSDHNVSMEDALEAIGSKCSYAPNWCKPNDDDDDDDDDDDN